MTTAYRSLSHSKYDCKYHVVFIPKRRKKELYGKIRVFLKSTFHELARQKGCEIVGGNMVHDHVHMLITIPPKYSVAEIIGYLKGKSAIGVQGNLMIRRETSTVNSFGPEAMLFRPWVSNSSR